MASLSSILEKIELVIRDKGFECYPLKVGWYNDEVSSPFKLPYSCDTLAVLLISKPCMFEKAFLPYIQHAEYGSSDPLDQCMTSYFQQLTKHFPDEDVEYMQDFELTPTRRPKILVQTAGHVSGAAYYYQRSDVKKDPWDAKKKICGVSLHPEYGGWFALRGVMIFKKVEIPDLVRKDPPDILKDDEPKIKLLELFNYHWQDWRFRDVIPVKEKYSNAQKLYFSTAPKERWNILKSLESQPADEMSSMQDQGHVNPDILNL